MTSKNKQSPEMQTASGHVACELYWFPGSLIRPPRCTFALPHVMRSMCSLTVAEELDLHVPPATLPRVTIKPLVASLCALTCLNVWWIREQWERLNNMFVRQEASTETTAVSWTQLGSGQVLWGRSEMLLNVRKWTTGNTLQGQTSTSAKETQTHTGKLCILFKWSKSSKSLNRWFFSLFLCVYRRDKERWGVCIALQIKC